MFAKGSDIKERIAKRRAAFLEQALPELHLRSLAQYMGLWDFLQLSRRREAYLSSAARAHEDLMLKQDLTSLPSPTLMRAMVGIGLVARQDFIAHIDALEPSALRDEAKATNLMLAFAGTIVAMHLESLDNSNAA